MAVLAKKHDNRECLFELSHSAPPEHFAVFYDRVIDGAIQSGLFKGVRKVDRDDVRTGALSDAVRIEVVSIDTIGAALHQADNLPPRTPTPEPEIETTPDTTPIVILTSSDESGEE